MNTSCQVVPESSLLFIAATDKNLCTRCGTCLGVCPTGALNLDRFSYPEIDHGLCIRCGLCGRVCAGGQVNFADLSELTFGHREASTDFDGDFRQSNIGYATDARLKSGGASGGVVSALLWNMLREGTIDGCIVTRMSHENPCQGEPFIASSYQDIVDSQQSKYIVIPVNALLSKLRRVKGRYAIVALPCQVHGLRLLQREAPALFKKIHVIIGLYCATSLEPNVAEEMLHARSIDPRDVARFGFREGEWPGRIQATLTNGEVRALHQSNFKDGAINYLIYLYSPQRCQTCTDGSAEFADISVADAWSRDSVGNYQFQGQSRCLVRTEQGMKVVQQAVAAGDVILQDVTCEGAGRTHQNHTIKKKVRAPLRVARLKKKKRPVPVYDREITESGQMERSKEWIDALLLQLGKRKTIRLGLWKFLSSDLGVPLIRIRQMAKRRRFKPS